MRAVRLVSATVFSTLAVAVPLATSAHASFPGANGKIVYAVSNATTFCPDIFTIKPDGTGNTKLTSCPEVATDPTWNASGTRIAFASTTQENHPLEIYTMASTGSGLFRVTNDSVEDADPSFNNAGTTIVEGRTRTGPPDTEDIATVPATGGAPAILLDGSPGNEVGEPEFSPDGTKVAFQKKSGPVFDVFTMNADVSNQVDLTPANDGNAGWPSWSPDQTKIAFASDRTGDWQIYTMNTDGTNVLQMTTEAGVDHIQPAWSPNGTMIAFTRGCDNDGCGNFQNGDIYVVNVTNPSAPGAPTPVVATSAGEYSPDWGVACTSNCPASVTRAVTIALKGALKATGMLQESSGEHSECVGGQKVSIQVNNGTSWKTVGTATTDGSGRYSKSIPTHSGRYRAVVPEADLSGGNVVCQKTTSAVSRMYHQVHRRAFVRFSVDRFGGGPEMTFLFDIKAFDGFRDCIVGILVQIQRQAGSRWVTIIKERTARTGKNQGGSGTNPVPARSGIYRAFAPRITIKGGNHTGDICKAAASKTANFS